MMLLIHQTASAALFLLETLNSPALQFPFGSFCVQSVVIEKPLRLLYLHLNLEVMLFGCPK